MTNSLLDADREHILAKTGDLWELFRNERIFITGGTGFVGVWLMEGFLAANERHKLNSRAVLLTRDATRFAARAPWIAANPAVELIEGDAVSFALPAGDFKFVIHAATERTYPATAQHPLATLHADLAATERVLRFAADRGTRRLLFTSSGAVYGNQPPGTRAVCETDISAPNPLEERAAYGEGKRVSEFACASYGRVFGFDAMVARLFAFIGPLLPLDEGYAAGNFIRDALAGQTIAVGGDGTAVRSYLYAADLSIWLWTILARGEGGRAYNTGSPDEVSISDLAFAVARAANPQLGVSFGRQPIQGAAPSRYVPDTQRAQNELQLSAWTPLEKAIGKTYTFYETLGRTSTAP